MLVPSSHFRVGLGLASADSNFKENPHLNKILSALDTWSSKDLNHRLSRELQGLRLTLRNLARESCPQIFWGECSQLGQRLSTHPQFGEIGAQLLQAVANSNSTLAKQAQHHLKVLAGQAGSLGEHLSLQLRQLSHTQTLAPVVGGIALGSLAGGVSGISALAKLSKTALPRFLGGAGLRAVSGVVSFVGEGVGFSLAERSLRQAILDQPVSWGALAVLQDVGHGMITMGGFRAAKTLGQGTWKIAHGVKGLGPVTRFHAAAKWTRPTTLLVSEFGGALGGGWLQGEPGQIANHHIASALGMMGHYRLALGTLHSAFPGLSTLQKALHRKTYEIGEGRWWHAFKNTVTSFNNFQGPQPSLATAGAHTHFTKPFYQPQATSILATSSYRIFTPTELVSMTTGLGENAFPKGGRSAFQKNLKGEGVAQEVARFLRSIDGIETSINKIKNYKLKLLARKMLAGQALHGIRNPIHALAQELGLAPVEEVALFTAWAKDLVRQHFKPATTLPPGEKSVLDEVRMRFFLVVGGRTQASVAGISEKTLIPYLQTGILPGKNQGGEKKFFRNLKELFPEGRTPLEEHGLLYATPTSIQKLIPEHLTNMRAALRARYRTDINEFVLQWNPEIDFSSSLQALPLGTESSSNHVTKLYFQALKSGQWRIKQITGNGASRAIGFLAAQSEKPNPWLRFNPLLYFYHSRVLASGLANFLTPNRLSLIQQDLAQEYGESAVAKGFRLQAYNVSQDSLFLLGDIGAVPIDPTTTQGKRAAKKHYGNIDFHALPSGRWRVANFSHKNVHEMATALIAKAEQDPAKGLIISPAWLFRQRSVSPREFAQIFTPRPLKLALQDLAATADPGERVLGIQIQAQYSKGLVERIRFDPITDPSKLTLRDGFKYIRISPPQGQSNLWAVQYRARPTQKDHPILAALKEFSHTDVKVVSVRSF